MKNGVAAAPVAVRVAIFLLLTYLTAGDADGDDIDFFYFVQQWPGSLCAGEEGCCFPKSGMPPNEFTIAGLYPAYWDGSTPTFCDNQTSLNRRDICDLIYDLEMHWPAHRCPRSNNLRLWRRQWVKRGSCSERILGRHGYFAAALRLRQQIDLLGILRREGIEADDRVYYLSRMRVAIQRATGLTPGFMCGVDESGEVLLQRVFLCADEKARGLVNCPLFPKSDCLARVKFPAYFFSPSTRDTAAGLIEEQGGGNCW